MTCKNLSRYLKINLEDIPHWLSIQFLETFCLVSNSDFTTSWLCEDGQSVNPLLYHKGSVNAYTIGFLWEFILYVILIRIEIYVKCLENREAHKRIYVS